MGTQPRDYQDANLREATLLMQAKGYEAEYWHTGGGIWCMHVHKDGEYCYEFGTADERFGYQRNDPAECAYLGGQHGYATDVRSDAPATALADWAQVVIENRTQGEHHG